MISVIVPIYNAAPYLARCLGSLLAQSYTDFEVILIDDASTDDSLLICEGFIAEHSERVRLLRNEVNRGQAASYLKGIEVARGEYVAFVDSDDWVAKDFLKRLFSVLDETGSDIAACSCWQVRNEARCAELSRLVECGSTLVLERADILQDMVELNTQGNRCNDTVKLYRCNKLFRKEIVCCNVGYVDTAVRMFEDNNLVIPCLLDARRVAFLNEALYFYNRHGGSTTGSYDPSILESNRRYLEVQRRIFSDRGLDHPLKFDAIMADSFAISKAIGCRASKENLLAALRAFLEHANGLGIGADDLVRARVSPRFARLLGQVRRGHIWRSYVLGRMFSLFLRFCGSR